MTYHCIGIPLLASILSFNCGAQSPSIIESLEKEDSSRTIFYLPANKRMDQMAWRDSVYRFSSFENGQLMFDTGFSPKEQVKMNYNLYYMQMDFISASGDTLQMKPSKEFKLITLNKHLFIYDTKIGYIEVIQQLPVALGRRSMMIVKHIDYPPGGNPRNVGFTPFGDQDQRGAAIGLDRYYQNGGDYFFIDKNSSAYKASSSAILKLFSGHKKTVKTYIDKHDLDFENVDQLTDLLVFCNELNEVR